MHLNLSRGKKHLLLVMCLVMFGACKQSEFYEKQGLSEIETSTGGSGGGYVPGDTGSNGGGNTGGGNTGNTGGGGNTTDPTTPIVVIDPTTPTTPVTPPVIVDPPVVVNPPVIVDPPVVVNPPVTEPPVVVNPPVVVVDPPVTPPTEPVVILNDRVETFTQNSAKSADVDILWMIDDSGSMADKQDAIARNFSSFINQFIAKDVDFKMAITTTDGTSTRNGKMVGDSAKLTSASAKGNRTAFIQNFEKWVKVGTSGSGVEQGLKTSVSFFDRYASSFLRKDAYLVIVYVSDEEDQSDKKVQEYMDKLLALKTNKGMVKAYSIVTINRDPKNSWETIGNRYLEVSKNTAGSSADIHSDFATTLLDMGGKIVNLIDSFALTESPYNDQVEVYVNNSKVASGYTFNASQRTVKFDVNSLPAEGSKVEVRYKVKATVLGAI